MGGPPDIGLRDRASEPRLRGDWWCGRRAGRIGEVGLTSYLRGLRINHISPAASAAIGLTTMWTVAGVSLGSADRPAITNRWSARSALLTRSTRQSKKEQAQAKG